MFGALKKKLNGWIKKNSEINEVPKKTAKKKTARKPAENSPEDETFLTKFKKKLTEDK